MAERLRDLPKGKLCEGGSSRAVDIPHQEILAFLFLTNPRVRKDVPKAFQTSQTRVSEEPKEARSLELQVSAMDADVEVEVYVVMALVPVPRRFFEPSAETKHNHLLPLRFHCNILAPQASFRSVCPCPLLLF
jgi:hypothetical protein